MKLQIKENSIIIDQYIYSPSKLFPNAIISPSNIDCVVEGLISPSIRTMDGEFIIFDYSEDDTKILNQYGIYNNIKIKKYINIWSNILEVFLDTEITEDENNRIFELLKKAGLQKDKVIEIRKEISEMMYDYNFNSGLWEWVDLNMTDLLNACIGKLNMNTKLTTEYFNDFYWEIMRIQDMGNIIA